MNFSIKLLTILSFVVSSEALARGVSVSPGEGIGNPLSYSNSLGGASRTVTQSLTINLRASCFARNLRGVANPVSPASTIEMSAELHNSDKVTPFTLRFPAQAVLGGATRSGSNTQKLAATSVTGLEGAIAGVSGNVIQVKSQMSSTFTIDPVTATVSELRSMNNVKNVKFKQIVNPGARTGMYLAKNGPLTTGRVSVGASSDGRSFDIYTSFPGQNGYCGGYYSPLMLFFGQTKPKFDQISQFDMKTGQKTYWPEANHAGYFLALPNSDGEIVSVKELFGDENGAYDNGFDKLSLFDKNKDGIIDEKDDVYKKLVLWKDTTGLGKFKKSDLIPLHQKVKSIKLKYNLLFEAAGKGAEYRQRSQFVLQDGRKTKGEIVDVWLKPVQKRQEASLKQ